LQNFGNINLGVLFINSGKINVTDRNDMTKWSVILFFLCRNIIHGRKLEKCKSIACIIKPIIVSKQVKWIMNHDPYVHL
jgi:hypothetical protein